MNLKKMRIRRTLSMFTGNLPVANPPNLQRTRKTELLRNGEPDQLLVPSLLLLLAPGDHGQLMMKWVLRQVK